MGGKKLEGGPEFKGLVVKRTGYYLVQGERGRRAE